MRRLPSSVRRPSVVCRMVICRKLSKIYPQLQWNSVGKLASLILLLHSDPPQTSRWGGSGFKFKICADINTASWSTLASDHSCCQPSVTVVSPTVLSTVVNEVRRSEPVVHNHRLLRWRRQSRAGGGPASYRSAKLLSPAQRQHSEGGIVFSRVCL